MCTNCFGGHMKKDCKSPKIQWIDYVSQFMDKYPDIPDSYYGKWAKIVDEWRQEQHRAPDAGESRTGPGSVPVAVFVNKKI